MLSRMDCCRSVIQPIFMTHLLFICSKYKWRSPTAEAIFAEPPQVDADSAGLANDAEVRLSDEPIEWADVILVMENIHRTRLNPLH